jgi:Tol biopolymer transport system component
MTEGPVMRAGQRFPVLLGLLLALVCSCGAEAGTTRRVSVSSEGTQTFYESRKPVVSADGHYVAFESRSFILVDDDTNDAWDIFLWDRLNGEVTRVSVGAGGAQGNGNSRDPSISWDGRYVAFESGASNLIAVDRNETVDIFVRDRATGYTSRVSEPSSGGDAWWYGDPVLSDPPCPASECECPDPYEYGNRNPSISADGRYVAFDSTSCSLDHLSDEPGAYVHDRATGETVRVSVNSNGFVRVSGTDPSISGDGRYVAFVYTDSVDGPDLVANDQNRASDVFVHDRSTGYTVRVSVATGGTEGTGGSGSPSISGDGRFVAFESAAFNLAPGDYNGMSDVFVHDRQTNETTLVSKTAYGQSATGSSGKPCLSPDGRYVSFESNASDLVEGDGNGCTDVFLHDRETGETVRVSVSTEGVETDGTSGASCVNATGRFVVFDSIANHLVLDDSNTTWDIFLRDRSWTTFDDVAQDDWAYEEIEACVEAGIVNGYADATYHPEEAVSRDQMAAFVSRALSGGDSNVPDGPATPSFDDVATDYWAYKYVEFAVAQGVVRGYPVGDQRLYRPANAVDRGQMAVFIARAHAGGDENVPVGPPAPTFPDVTTGNEWQWCYDHVEYVALCGIACGYEDDLYHPEYTCSRDQMAVFIARSFGLLP